MAQCLRLTIQGSTAPVLRASASSSCQLCFTSKASTKASAAEQMEAYWERNKRCDRPLSPHLTIYKYNVPMTLSITNRITGSIVAGAMYAAPFLYMMSSKDFTSVHESLAAAGPVMKSALGVGKFSLAFCFSYHFWASIRHMFWDMAMGFKLPQVYLSGYALVAATLVSTIALMCL